MWCLSEDDLHRLAAGTLTGLRRLLAHRHLRRCRSCRTRFYDARELMGQALPYLASVRGYLPRDQVALKRRVLRAITEGLNQPEREPSSPERSYPRVRRALVPLTAAAATLLIILLGVRFLGGSRWIGRLESFRGALLFSPEDGNLASLSGHSKDIEPGDLLLIAPGGHGRLVLDDVGEAEITGASIVVVGDPDRGEPLLVARGAMRLSRKGGRTFAVRTGDLVFEVEVEAGLEVEPRSPLAATGWASDAAAAVRAARDAGILPPAGAAAEDGLAFAAWVHAIGGPVRATRGHRHETITAGYSATYGEEGRRTHLREAGVDDLLAHVPARRLTSSEADTVSRLLSGSEDAIGTLIETAEDPGEDPSSRGLAIWLIGELGDEGPRDRLRSILANDAPAATRAAAVRALALLGDAEAVESALVASDPAVCEAAIQALPRVDRDRAALLLPAVASDPGRPAFVRAFAAAHAAAAGARTPIGDLVELSVSADPAASRIASDLLSARREPEAVQALLAAARTGPPASRAEAFELLRGRGVGEALGDALRAWSGEEDPRLRAAALRYLGKTAPKDVEPFLADALEGGPGPIRAAALDALRSVREHVVARHRQRLLEILEEEGAPREDATGSLSLLHQRAGGLEESILVRLLASAHHEVRMAALGKLRGPAHLDRFLAATEDESPHVRKQAWMQLALVEPGLDLLSRIVTALLDGTISDPGEVDGATNLALRRIRGPEAVRGVALLGQLCREDAPVELRALGAWLLKLPLERQDPGALELSGRILARPLEHPHVLADAAYALASARSDEPARDLIRTALGSRHPAVAAAAARGLLELKKAGELPEDAGSLFRVPASDPFTRAALALLPPIDVEEVRGLLTGPYPTAVATLLLNLPDEQTPPLRREIESAATSLGRDIRALALCRYPAGPEGVGFLTSLLSDPDPEVRLCARAGLLAAGEPVTPRDLATALTEAVPPSQLSYLGRLEKALRADAPDLATGIAREAQQDATGLVRRILLEVFQGLERARPARLDTTTEEVFALKRARFATRLEDVVRESGALAVRLLREGSVAERRQAARTLAWAGGRAAIARLVTALRGEEEPEVRADVLGALEKLTGLRLYGPADHEEIETWWGERAYALDVPLLPNRNGEAR